jgi:hypothetical protein
MDRLAPGRARPRRHAGPPAALASAVGRAGRPRVGSDLADRSLQLGSVVVVRGGDHAGRLAEVVGWGGRRGIELVAHGEPPAFFAIRPDLVELVEIVVLDPVVPRRRKEHA